LLWVHVTFVVLIRGSTSTEDVAGYLPAFEIKTPAETSVATTSHASDRGTFIDA